MVRTIDIPQERWTSFLDTINRAVNGRPVRIEVSRRELGDQEMGQLLPLIDVELEEKGPDAGELVIAVGSDRGELTHVIDKPTGIAVGVGDANETQWIAIHEEGEATTIIHFEHLPMLEQEYGATT